LQQKTRRFIKKIGRIIYFLRFVGEESLFLQGVCRRPGMFPVFMPNTEKYRKALV